MTQIQPEATSPLLALYAARIDGGLLQPDPAQFAVLQTLDAFRTCFLARPTRRRGLFAKPRQAMQGLYIHGGVGRGKTMLMDLLTESLPAAETRWRRVHFHAFMLEIHDRLNTLRHGRSGAPEPKKMEAIWPRIACDIATAIDLLCFDELHVNDIADAMILGPLCQALHGAGVTLIATSNYAAHDLYKNGLQRDRFLPFLDFLAAHTTDVPLVSDTDYRQRALSESGVYFCPLTDQSWLRMTSLIERLTAHAKLGPTQLSFKGRTLDIPMAGHGLAWLQFQTLCGEARGTEDYLAIGSHFSVLVLDNVPRMAESSRNEVRRFMTLIDTLYDLKRVVVIRAAVPPMGLYDGDTHKFEFERTISRLLEMQSPDWFSRLTQGTITP